jgi:hypothetical protein
MGMAVVQKLYLSVIQKNILMLLVTAIESMLSRAVLVYLMALMPPENSGSNIL